MFQVIYPGVQAYTWQQGTCLGLDHLCSSEKKAGRKPAVGTVVSTAVCLLYGFFMEIARLPPSPG